MKNLSMKKLVLSVFVLVLCVSLVGCGNKKTEDKGISETNVATGINDQKDTSADENHDDADLLSDKDYVLHTKMEIKEGDQVIAMEMKMQKLGNTVYMDYIDYPTPEGSEGITIKKTVINKDKTYVNYMINNKNIWTQAPAQEDIDITGFIDVDKLFAMMEEKDQEAVTKEVDGKEYSCYEKVTQAGDTFCFEDKVLKYVLVQGETIKILEYTHDVTDPLFELPNEEEILSPEEMNAMIMGIAKDMQNSES